MKSLLFLNLIALFVALISGNVTGNTESNYVKA